MGQSPGRFTGRSGSRLPGRVRRALDAQVDTERRLNGTLKVDKDGRMGTNVARKGGLLETPQGLAIDTKQVGEMNRPPIDHLRDLESTATASEIVTKVNALFALMRKTGEMRGF
jgi:hypothetical protein